MTPPPPPGAARPADVLIVGGGIAGVEALLALTDHGERRLRVHLVANHPSFVLRPQILGVPWGSGPTRVSLADLAAAYGARFTQGTVTTVDVGGSTVWTAAGDELTYDRLLLTPGARQSLPYPLARVLGFGALPRTLAESETADVAIVVPPGTSWTLPAYELAVLTATDHPGRTVTVHTPEHTPLEAFGPGVHDAVATFLARRGVRVRTDAAIAVGTDVEGLADTVIALPLLSGPRLAGVSSDAGGFIRVDAQAVVRDAEGVYAAGDAADHPIKQGGLAAQQATIAAVGIVRSCGGTARLPVSPLVLRGKLTAGGEELFLRRMLDGDDDGIASARALWMPPGIVCAWRLSRWLTSSRADLVRTDLEHAAPRGNTE